MKTLTYPVDIEIGQDGVTITFPDLPYGVASGETVEEALYNASDALEEVLAGLVNDKQPIPKPSDEKGRPIVAPSARFAAKILLYITMREQGINKAELARRLDWGYQQVDRLFDFKHASHFTQLSAAFSVLGKKLLTGIEDAKIYHPPLIHRETRPTV